MDVFSLSDISDEEAENLDNARLPSFSLRPEEKVQRERAEHGNAAETPPRDVSANASVRGSSVRYRDAAPKGPAPTVHSPEIPRGELNCLAGLSSVFIG